MRRLLRQSGGACRIETGINRRGNGAEYKPKLPKAGSQGSSRRRETASILSDKLLCVLPPAEAISAPVLA